MLDDVTILFFFLQIMYTLIAHYVNTRTVFFIDLLVHLDFALEPKTSDVVWDRKSETKKIGLGLGLAHCGLGLGLAGLVWFCENDLVTLVVIMILKDTATFQVLFIVSLFCARNITTVEINSGVYLLKN